MLKEYKRKSNLVILLGIAVQFGGGIIADMMEIDAMGAAFRFSGAILFIVGCCYYAKGKGHNSAWGLLGLLSLIGLLVLVCLRDRHKAT